jgi:arylsulfatase
LGIRDEIAGGLVIGLGWGLVVAVADGLSLLLQGDPTPYLGARLLALAYLAAIYGMMGAVLGGVLAGLLRAARRLVPRIGDTRTAVFGMLVALTVAAALVQRFQPGAAGWVVIAALAVGAGLASGWLAGRIMAGAARGPAAPERSGVRAGKVAPGIILAVFLVALLGVVGVAIARALPRGQAPQAVDADGLPNIVLITADGIRADHLGAYGYDPAISPNLDALAANGVRVEQAMAPGSWGRPSAAALVTALYPGALGYACGEDGCSSPAPDAKQLTLAEALQGQGYHTAAVLASPWLNDAGFAQGLDHFEAAREQEPFDDAPMRARLLGRLLGCREGSAACRIYRQGRGSLFDTRLIANQGGEAINAAAARWLSRLPADGEPYFMWVHYDDALPPYDLAEPFRPVAEGALASPVRRLKSLGYWELGAPFTARAELLPEDAPGLAALYDGEVQRVDRVAGELIALLREQGKGQNTLVVFAGTHGQELAEHGSYTYGHTLYEEVVRVPLIVSYAGVGDGLADLNATAGEVVTLPVSLVDVVPTLLGITGTAVRDLPDLPGQIHGQSLVPWPRDAAEEERPVYSEALYRVAQPAYALRRGAFKLIYYADDGRTELYDLEADPGETNDLTAEQPELVSQMLREMQKWIAKSRDEAPHLRSPGPAAATQELW